MSEPAIAGRKPILVRFEREGETIFWCACGKSARQPFCDGSHKGTAFTPRRIVARYAGEEALFCACKRTKTPPYCDGSHNALGAYGDASVDEIIDWNAAVAAPRNDGVVGRADLDGGCYVLTPDWRKGVELGGVRLLATIARDDGADQLSQFLLRPQEGGAEAISFGDAETVLFIARGAARICVGSAQFEAPLHSALALRPGEAFRVFASGTAQVEIVATVCPPAPPRLCDAAAFDTRYQSRVTALDQTARHSMGERFYQVLSAPEKGATDVTEFIGAIPKSRAPAHRHLYEESLLILSGEGVMWTQSRKAAVVPGDVVYLPKKQLHSLECVSDGGMTLAGSFFPAGSPAVNY